VGGDDALALGERVRRRIAGIAGKDPASWMTASIGIAACPHDATDYNKLFETADQRLYQAKAAGRDRVVSDGKTPSTADASEPSLVPAG
jgi:diguanylate cyclase (GGDEF)-like protein